MMPTTPNLFLIGPPKAGTTALHRYLRDLPGVFMSTPKELRALAPDMYPDRPELSDADYAGRFASAPTDARYLGESSPFYLRSEIAPSRVAALSPNARMIVVIRHPVELIRSLHQQNVRDRSDPLLDLEAALMAETFRVRGIPFPAHATHTVSPLLHYRRTATLAPQLARWLRLFARERFHFVSYAGLVHRTTSELERLHQFLGLHVVPRPMSTANPSTEVRFPWLARWVTAPPSWLRHGARAIPSRARGPLVHRAWRLLLRQKGDAAPTRTSVERLLPLFREDIAEVERLTGVRVELSSGVSGSSVEGAAR